MVSARMGEISTFNLEVAMREMALTAKRRVISFLSLSSNKARAVGSSAVRLSPNVARMIPMHVIEHSLTS